MRFLRLWTPIGNPSRTGNPEIRIFARQTDTEPTSAAPRRCRGWKDMSPERSEHEGVHPQASGLAVDQGIRFFAWSMDSKPTETDPN